MISHKQVKDGQEFVRERLRDGCLLCLFGSHSNFTAPTVMKPTASQPLNKPSSITRPKQHPSSVCGGFHIAEEEGTGLNHVFPFLSQESTEDRIVYPEYRRSRPIAAGQPTILEDDVQHDDQSLEMPTLHMALNIVTSAKPTHVAPDPAPRIIIPDEEGRGLGHVYPFLNHDKKDRQSSCQQAVTNLKEKDNMSFPVNEYNEREGFGKDEVHVEPHASVEGEEGIVSEHGRWSIIPTTLPSRDETKTCSLEEEASGLAHVFPFLTPRGPEKKCASTTSNVAHEAARSVAAKNDPSMRSPIVEMSQLAGSSYILDDFPQTSHTFAAPSKAFEGFLSTHQAIIERQATQDIQSVAVFEHRHKILNKAAEFLTAEAQAHKCADHCPSDSNKPSRTNTGISPSPAGDDKISTSIFLKELLDHARPSPPSSPDLESIDYTWSRDHPVPFNSPAPSLSSSSSSSASTIVIKPSLRAKEAQQAANARTINCNSNALVTWLATFHDGLEDETNSKAKNERYGGFSAPLHFRLWKRVTSNTAINHGEESQGPEASKTQKRREERKRAKALMKAAKEKVEVAVSIVPTPALERRNV
ncbi:MAG: hypothetical protein Q9163_004057 [Psora crenata]